jgi:hypothetical protein
LKFQISKKRVPISINQDGLADTDAAEQERLSEPIASIRSHSRFRDLPSGGDGKAEGVVLEFDFGASVFEIPKKTCGPGCDERRVAFADGCAGLVLLVSIVSI